MAEIKSNADIEPCLTAVMPVYNEAATVAEVIRVVLAQRPVQQLVIVDDCSRTAPGKNSSRSRKTSRASSWFGMR